MTDLFPHTLPLTARIALARDTFTRTGDVPAWFCDDDEAHAVILNALVTFTVAIRPLVDAARSMGIVPEDA